MTKLHLYCTQKWYSCSEVLEMLKIEGSIVQETNRYAHQVLGPEANTKWTDVTAEDIWTFPGFALLTGIIICHSYTFTGTPTSGRCRILERGVPVALCRHEPHTLFISHAHSVRFTHAHNDLCTQVKLIRCTKLYI